MSFRNLLLNDDDKEDQEIFLTALETVFSSVHCTALKNPLDALEKLGRHELNPDVIFLDLNMPVMNGQQFLMEIKKDEALKRFQSLYFPPLRILAQSNSQKNLVPMTSLQNPVIFKSWSIFLNLLYIN